MVEQEEIIVYTFEQDNNVDEGEIMMRMRYVDSNGVRIPLLEKPCRVIAMSKRDCATH